MQVSTAARQPVLSYLATPAASWLDDYLVWISPQLPACCRLWPTNSTQCPTGDAEPCVSDPKSCAACQTCFLAGGTSQHGERVLHGRPTLEQVQHTLPWFLQSSPGMHCAKGGRGAYDTALAMDADGQVIGLRNGTVAASAYRANNVPLATQQDFIGALQVGRYCCDDLLNDTFQHDKHQNTLCPF